MEETASSGFPVRPLLRLAPALRKHWLRLIDAPTPVRRLAALGVSVGHSELWIKEDQVANSQGSGFKARKLEFLLGDAKLKGADTVVTFGAVGGSHVLATALLAQGHLTRTVLFLSKQPLAPGSVAQHNLQRLLQTNAVRVWTPLFLRVLLERSFLLAARVRGEHAGRTYVIPTGGSNGLGCLGAVNAALELGEQLHGMGETFPEAIYVAGGSSGTAAGLALGIKLLGVRSRIRMVAVASPLFASLARAHRLALGTRTLLRSHGFDCPAVDPLPLDVIRGFEGTGYGHATAAGVSARSQLRRLEAIDLDDTYTAKAMAAFLECASMLPRGSARILFWNTLGYRRQRSGADPGRLLDLGVIMPLEPVAEPEDDLRDN